MSECSTSPFLRAGRDFLRNRYQRLEGEMRFPTFARSNRRDDGHVYSGYFLDDPSFDESLDWDDHPCSYADARLLTGHLLRVELRSRRVEYFNMIRVFLNIRHFVFRTPREAIVRGISCLMRYIAYRYPSVAWIESPTICSHRFMIMVFEVLDNHLEVCRTSDLCRQFTWNTYERIDDFKIRGRVFRESIHEHASELGFEAAPFAGLRHEVKDRESDAALEGKCDDYLFHLRESIERNVERREK